MGGDGFAFQRLLSRRIRRCLDNSSHISEESTHFSPLSVMHRRCYGLLIVVKVRITIKPTYSMSQETLSHLQTLGVNLLQLRFKKRWFKPICAHPALFRFGFTLVSLLKVCYFADVGGRSENPPRIFTTF